MHLGIDFLAILVDFGYQVGVKNQAKIDQKWHRKNDAKNKAVWDASWAVFGPSRAPRRTPTQSNGTQRDPTGRKSCPGGRQGRRPFAQKYLS